MGFGMSMARVLQTRSLGERVMRDLGRLEGTRLTMPYTLACGYDATDRQHDTPWKIINNSYTSAPPNLHNSRGPYPRYRPPSSSSPQPETLPSCPPLTRPQPPHRHFHLHPPSPTHHFLPKLNLTRRCRSRPEVVGLSQPSSSCARIPARNVARRALATRSRCCRR